MKIAIVAPSPVPFVIGGAEKLWWGLLEQLNKSGEHQVELIKLPSPENNFWSIMHSYHEFSRLNLDHFDRIISTKYPAWIISHPEHLVYLQHRLRGLYDCYPPELARNPFENIEALPDSWQNFLFWVRDEFMPVEPLKRRKELQLFWSRLFELESGAETETFLNLPGPVCRYLVHCLDQIALDASQIQTYYAISQTVAAREEYFPSGIIPKVISHPSDIVIKPTDEDKGFVFTASRLDAPKRIDWLLKAYAEAAIELPLKIAGTGPQEAELKTLSSELGIADKVDFLGFVSNTQLVGYYQQASFIVFIPYDEDMGLITLEAQQAGKAVLTLNDSGGVKEFVQHQRNGFIADSVSALAGYIRKLGEDSELAGKLGKQAYADVQAISWQKLVDEFTGPALMQNSTKPKMLVVNTFNCYPVNSGGKARMYYLYKALSSYYKIEMVVLDTGVKSLTEIKFSEDFTQWLVPATEEIKAFAFGLEQRLGVSAFDLAVMLKPELNPEYCQILAKKAPEANAIVSAHCYVFPSIELSTRNLTSKGGRARLIYDAHNIEWLLKKEMLESIEQEEQGFADSVLDKVKQCESSLILNSDEIWACSEYDIDQLKEIYMFDGNIRDTLFKNVPNGVDFDFIRPLSEEIKETYKKEVDLDQFSKLAVFMGSLHQPNINALNSVIEMANQTKEVGYIILGSVVDSLLGNNKSLILPDNVLLIGMVSNAEKKHILSLADFGLNPVIEGSGTNLKVFDYIKHNLLVISTPKGMRGISLDSSGIERINIEYFSNCISALCNKSSRTFHKRVMDTQYSVRENYDWNNIVNKSLKPVKGF